MGAYWKRQVPKSCVRRFGIILEKSSDRHKRSEIAVQWNGGGVLMRQSPLVLICLIWVYILDSKRNAYFQYPFNTRKPLSNFPLNDMNMFERIHVFVPDHFIRLNTAIFFFFLLINAKNAKTVLYSGKHMI